MRTEKVVAPRPALRSARLPKKSATFMIHRGAATRTLQQTSAHHQLAQTKAPSSQRIYAPHSRDDQDRCRSPRPVQSISLLCCLCAAPGSRKCGRKWNTSRYLRERSRYESTVGRSTTASGRRAHRTRHCHPFQTPFGISSSDIDRSDRSFPISRKLWRHTGNCL